MAKKKTSARMPERGMRYLIQGLLKPDRWFVVGIELDRETAVEVAEIVRKDASWQGARILVERYGEIIETLVYEPG